MLDFGDVYVPAEDGTFISEKHARIAEIIKDYEPTLELAWIPPDKRNPGDKPFAVIHRPLGGQPYIVCYADEADERLLGRVFSMDQAAGNPLAAMDAHNAAIKAVELKKQQEEMDEAHDLAASVLRSPLNVYKHNGVVFR